MHDSLSLAEVPTRSRCEGMVTRARRRRLHVESLELLVRKKGALVHDDPEDWRDWANLLPELIEGISCRLLSLDVAEYVRFRAVCRPWRDLTADPRGAGPLDSRFRPRNWVVVTMTPDAGPRRRLLNLATAASLSVDLPALSTHCHLGATDGLLVLFHLGTQVIRLLDPLSNAVTNFPAISRIVAAVAPSSGEPEILSIPHFRGPCGIHIRAINGAGLDDSTSPPTLVLCLRDIVCRIVFAKPGDAHWKLVTPGEASYSKFDATGQVLFHSLLSRGGRCYVASPEGSVFILELPRLVEVVNQRHVCRPGTHHLRNVISFLVDADGNGGDERRMLMVRYWRNIEKFGGRGAYNPAELFTVGGLTGRMEVLEVDIPGKRLFPVRSLGLSHAVFVGETHCLLISTKIFPSVAADAIHHTHELPCSA